MSRAIFFCFVVLLIVTLISCGEPKKPLCEMCENLVNTVDDALSKGDDIAEAISEYCHEQVPAVLVAICVKVAKNVKFIITKLRDHESAEQICSDLYLCYNRT